MPDPQQYDLSTAAKDPDFLKASVPDKMSFLAAHDADFAKAHPSDKAGYLNHIMGNDTPTQFEKQNAMPPNERQANEFLLGAASGASGLPETTNPIGDAMKSAQKPNWKNIAAESVFPGASIARNLYGTASQIFSPQKQNESPDDAAERRAHGIGSAVGQVAPAMMGDAVDSGAVSMRGPREFLAQKSVAPLVKKPLGATQADMKFGRDPVQAITDEGLVGSKAAMAQQASQRLSQLSSTADKQLANHPNAKTITDVEPIIDGAIDTAQSAAKKVGQKGVISRLEDLREALKTQYGPLKGTPLDINRLKQSIGDAASDLGAFKHTDPLESSAASAMSDVYSRLNGVVKGQVPEIGPLNDRMANLISAKTGLNRNIASETNKSLLDGSVSSLPLRLANKTVTSAPVRSGVARMLNMGNTLDVPQVDRYYAPPTPINTPRAAAANPIEGMSAQAPKFKGGINQKGVEASNVQMSPEDTMTSLSTEIGRMNTKLRNSASSPASERQALQNQINQYQQRLDEMRD